jgi:Beta-propeller repeat
MQTKSPVARIAAYITAALAISAVFIFAAFDHVRNTSRAIAAQPTVVAAGLAALNGAPVELEWKNAYGKLPLAFEANQGQTATDVRFLSRGDGYSLFLTEQEAVLALRQPALGGARRLDRTKLSKVRSKTRGAEKLAVLRMRLDGANPNAAVAGINRMPTRVNYFIGNDPKRWHTEIPTYSQVKYHEVYPGVDLLFYGNQRRLEYDFLVAPGADAKAIALDVQGASKLRIDLHGNLRMKVAGGEVELQKPVIFQEVNGERREIAGNYAIANNHEVRFSISNYDGTQPLTIDPVLNYVTYLGGSGSLGDTAFGIALDSAGNAYVAGKTFSTDFPTKNPESTTPPDTAANGTAFVSELNPTGTALLYSTYLGGSGNGSFGDSANAIAVDTASPANIYVTGFTGSPDFPVSASPLINQPGPAGTGTSRSAFVTKLVPGNIGATQLAYSSYLGGDTQDDGNGIAVDSGGDVYITGLTLSTNFPHTANAYSTTLLNPNGSAFLTEISIAPTGVATLVYSTYFGGTNGAGNAFLFGDLAMGVTVDNNSNAYIVGTTTSTDFPPTTHVVSSCLTDTNGIAFVSVINTTTPALKFSTCLGGAATQTQGVGIALGPNNVVYVTGETSSPDFPVTANSIPPAAAVTTGVAFVSLLNTASATPNQYSTFLGGNGGDAGLGIATDATGNAYVVGGTGSPDFPITQGAILETLKNLNATGFVAKINPGGNGIADLLYSSYFGGSGNGSINDAVNGIAVSASNNAYITGLTSSSDLPVTPGVIQSKLNSTATNAFVADLTLVPTISILPPSHDFGIQLVGTPTAPFFFTVMNNSASSINLPLTITVTATSGAATDFAAPAAGGTCVAGALAAGTSCTLGVTYTPSAVGSNAAVLQTPDSADLPAHSLTVALAGVGSNTVPTITLTPASLTLPGALLTTSTTGTVSIGNSGNAPLSISAIAAAPAVFTAAFNTATCNNGNFPIVIAPAGAACIVTVTFAPTAATPPGPVSGTLTITQTGGAMSTVPLTGPAWDFSASAAAISVAKGATGSFTVNVVGLGGFTGAVAFACAPGTGALITSCSVPTTNAAPAPGATASGSITAASFVVPPQSMKMPPSALLRQVLFIMMAIGLLFMLPSVRRFRTRLGLVGAMMVFVLVAGCSGNGGGGGSKSSTISITPSSGGVTKTAITVNVTITQ